MRFKSSIIALSTSTFLITAPAFAERTHTQQALVEGGTFTSMAIAGAVAGGPVGMIVGALGGAFLADQTRKANNSEIQLHQQEAEMVQMETHLARSERDIANMEVELLQKLTFQVLFATGEDALTELDIQRVEKLANYLKSHPNLLVNLDGHTDIRGSDEYNNVLSLERAKAVKQALIEQGIEDTRITHKGFGSEFAEAEKGDKDGYAKDRKVIIELMPEQVSEESLAQF